MKLNNSEIIILRCYKRVALVRDYYQTQDWDNAFKSANIKKTRAKLIKLGLLAGDLSRPYITDKGDDFLKVLDKIQGNDEFIPF